MKSFKKILNDKKIVYIIVFLIIFLSHFFLKVNSGDDVFFKTAMNDGFINFLTTRYNSWSSRLIIEIVLVFMLKLPKIIWMLIDSGMLVLTIYSIDYLFTKRSNLEKLLVAILVLLYPLSELRSAGWYATTINYLWPLALGLFAFFPIKHAKENIKEKGYMYPLYVLATLFACNQEQMGAIIFGIYAISIYNLYKHKKLNKFIIIQTLIALISLIFILTCPGNGIRAIANMDYWYPSYSNFTIMHKSFLGVVTTFLFMTKQINVIVFITSLLIPYLTFKKDNFLNKFISMIPIFIIIAICMCSNVTIKFFPELTKLLNHFSLFLEPQDKINFGIYNLALLGVSFLFFASLFYSMISLVDKKNRVLVFFILMAGFASRFIIGFTPSVYASSMRTFIFFDFSIIIALVLTIFDNIKNIKNKNALDFGIIILILLDFLQVFNLILK